MELGEALGKLAVSVAIVMIATYIIVSILNARDKKRREKSDDESD